MPKQSPYLQEPLTRIFPDKGMLVLGSIEFHALAAPTPIEILCCSDAPQARAVLWLCAALISSSCHNVMCELSPSCGTQGLPIG